MGIINSLKGVNEEVCKDVIATMVEAYNFDGGIQYLHSVEDGLTPSECLGIYVVWCAMHGEKCDEGEIKRWVQI